MKKIYYIAFVMACVLMHVSCSDNLNTNPTDQISGNVLFKDVEGGMVAMNGVYRLMYSTGWAGDNSTHALDICQLCWFPILWEMIWYFLPL